MRRKVEERKKVEKKLKETNVAGAHTDYGCVTLLFQKPGESGLQLYAPTLTPTPSSKSSTTSTTADSTTTTTDKPKSKWQDVPYIPASPTYAKQGMAPPLVVNIGDQLSYWTNGLLKSTLHRVRFPQELIASGKDRYSIVFFAHPDDDSVLEPVPCKLVDEYGKGDGNGRGAAFDLVKFGKSITAREHLDRRLAQTYGWKY
ncbi:unnamed protein product [Ambrosiozyma monospora]|uniref:Unnamed protein product n=1 Tax=Ambrosiozyma monospora TaxID=43982 RepID=A0ACB5TC40_AMBMO|nr:unnamed protein product [Ambrosiozyma monospora]